MYTHFILLIRITRYSIIDKTLEFVLGFLTGQTSKKKKNYTVILKKNMHEVKHFY